MRRALVLVIACGGAPEQPLPVALTPRAPEPMAEKVKASPYPETERVPVVDTYFGAPLVDSYRWLEDGKDPKVIAWTAAQNELTRARLDAIAGRDAIRARVSELMGKKPPSYTDISVRGELVFAKTDQPPKQQPLLVVTRLDKPGSQETVLDPNVLDPTGATAIDFYVPSRDGKKVAVSLSTGGSERGDVHVYDVATGKDLDTIPRVNNGTAGGSVAWNADGTGLWFTRYPAKGERAEADLDFYQQVYFHTLGKTEDRYVLGKDFPRIAEITLASSDDGKRQVIRVANGDGGQFAFYASDDRGGFTQIAAFDDAIVEAKFGADGNLYALTRKEAPKGAIVRRRYPFAKSKWEPLVPEGDGSIERFVVSKSRVYVAEVVGGPSRLRAFHLDKPDVVDTLDVPFKVPAIFALERIGADDVLYLATSYTNAPTVFRLSGTKSTATIYAMAMPYDMDDVEVIRDRCVSADGTEVPINILRKKGIALDGAHPALLTGYGGYGISRVPGMRPIHRLWLDQGGVFADANLRGGRENGEAWHEAGRLTRKQNVFDDFAACAKRLVEAGYTKPARLAIIGGSNGGLLVGAMLTQHPDMVRAVVAQVGIYDSLRFELTPNGAFNVTELGTVTDEAQFRAMRAYSPYHNVSDGTAYPAVLFTTGANDPRVDPYNSRKMTARLQAATSSEHPILLRASSDVGHGMGTPLAAGIDELTDIDAFLADEVGAHL